MNRNVGRPLALAVLASLLFVPGRVAAYSGYGDHVNQLCAPQQPYAGDCSLCHAVPDYGARTPAKDAYLAGGDILINYFCPAKPPACTDNDNDNYAVEGGDCGLVDCNDAAPSIHPGATEICGDGIDQDCSGSDLTCSPGAIPPVLHLLRDKK